MLRRVQDKKNQLDRFRPLTGIEVRSIKESLTLEWTYNSNGIEGNSLTLRETKMVLEEGMTVKGKSLREHFEAVNHQDAIEHVESLVHPSYKLQERDILDVQALVLQRIEKEYAGRYRTSGVRISGANFVPPNALKIDRFMSELLDWVQSIDAEIHPLIKATIFHHRFVWIHPFFDGNGRTARLITNLLVMKHGYPPLIILKNDRQKYYRALNQANKEDYGKLLLLMLQSMERSLDIYLGALDNRQEDYQLISDIVSEPEVPYGQEYVSLLARRGKIDAYKEGRNWFTTKEAVVGYSKRKERK